MALIGSLATLRAQAARTSGFATAFSYIDDLMRPDSPARNRLRAITEGHAQRVELGDGVFAMEQVYQTKPRAEGFFESHRKYIDVQVVVEGQERIEVIESSRITMREPYVAERDLILYFDASDASELRLLAGEAAIFYPVDVHMPSLRLHTASELVRKTVVKVPVIQA
jgi:biofilm protein TabA